MKKLLLLVVMLLNVVGVCAQNYVLRVNGTKAREELMTIIKSEEIESMTKSVIDGVPTMDIKLREGVTLSDIEKRSTNEAVKQKSKNERIQNAVNKVIEEQYNQTTLLKEGDKAAEFTLTMYEGEELKLSELRGKIVLITFWGSWCAPCLVELAPEALPKLILERFADNSDFVFLPIACSDTKEKLDAFFATDRGKELYSYLSSMTGIDPKREILSLYATQGVPRSVLVGRDGTIEYGSVGYTELNLQKCAEAIEKALKKIE